MSRRLRTLALSASMLAMTASAFAMGPGGTNPPPPPAAVHILSLLLAVLGL